MISLIRGNRVGSKISLLKSSTHYPETMNIISLHLGDIHINVFEDLVKTNKY